MSTEAVLDTVANQDSLNDRDSLWISCEMKIILERYDRIVLTLEAISNASSRPNAASDRCRIHTRIPLVSVVTTMKVNDTTATIAPQSCSVLRKGGGCRPAI